MKKILKFTGIGLLTLLLLLFTLPFLFKNKILVLVKSEINKNIEAKVEFSDLSLSLFRHFPKLTVVLKDVSVTGTKEFAKDTLLSAPVAEASVNIQSMFSGKEMTVYGIYLKAPRIKALVTAEGKANWEITKTNTSETTDTTASAVALDLQKYAITDGYVFYEDKSMGMHTEILHLDHEGSGSLTGDVFTLSTNTKTGAANFTYAAIPYLVNAQTGIEADIQIDSKTASYTFKKAALQVNNLKLIADGFFQLVDDSTYKMDIIFDAPSNEFKDILSLVPAIYKNDFDKIKTSGTAAFKGFVKGSYSPQQMPAYKIDLAIKKGFFQYPDLPQPVKNIQVEALLSNKDGNPDNAIVNITKGHLEMGAEPVDFKLLFTNPETSRYIDAAVKGNINLAEITQFVKLEEGTKLSGKLMADAFVKGNLAAIQNQNGAFSAGGFFNIQNLYYASKQFPQPVQNGNFKMELQNNGGSADATVINISTGHIEIAKDPLDFSFVVRNPVTSMDFNGTAKGRLTLNNVAQFVTFEPGTSLRGLLHADVAFSGSKAAIDKKEYGNIKASGKVDVADVNYVSKEYPAGVKLNKAQLLFSPQEATLTNSDGAFMGSRFTANGTLSNLIGYALQQQTLYGTLNLTADKINLNDWMGTDTAATVSTAEALPFAVPADLNLALNAQVGSVQYDKVTYNNVNGALQLKDETVFLKDVQTEALGGTVKVNGSYSTKIEKTQPAIAMSYDVKGIDIQQAFYAFNTVQKLMPIGRFLSGKLTSQLNMNGRLDAAMMPDLSSLTGKGNLLLIEGVLSKFLPLENVAASLNVAALKNISLKDIKSHFEFANGKVLVKPFSFQVKDMDIQVGGMHGFDQSMEYLVGMKLPRSYMGATGNELVNNLAAKATGKGIAVSVSETVNLNVKIGGSIANPMITTGLKETAGDAVKEMKLQAAAFVQQKIDSSKQVFKDSLTVVKKELLDDAKKELEKQLFANKDSVYQPASLNDAKKKAGETIKNTIGGFLKKKKAPADTTQKH